MSNEGKPGSPSPGSSSSSSHDIPGPSTSKRRTDMSASYSEISDAGRNDFLSESLESSGHVHYDGDMTHFVADDLEFKIKIASPTIKSPLQDDVKDTLTLLDELEEQAEWIAHSVDNLIENLSGILHSNSSLATKNVLIYGESVQKTCNEMDGSIRTMYTVLAKSEELLRVMGPVKEQAAKVAQLKRLVQTLDSIL